MLAVGDAEFQKKCLGKMGEAARGGRTVLFVSHNIAAVNRLCRRALMLESGRLTCDNEVNVVTEYYLARPTSQNSQAASAQRAHLTLAAKSEIQGLRITGVTVVNEAHLEVGPRTGDPLLIRIEYEARRHIPGIAFLIRVSDRLMGEVFRLSTRPISGFAIEKLYGRALVELRVEWLALVAGRYTLDLEVFQEARSKLLEFSELLDFEVAPGDVYRSGLALDRSRGLIAVPHEWTHTPK